MSGKELARSARPTLEEPWVECRLPGTERPIVVIQFQPERYVVRTLVFVDGVSLADGLTLDAWRLQRPTPLDRFEQVFSGRLWGPAGALLVGLVCALPALVQLERAPDPIWAVMAAGGFAISAGWMGAMIMLVRWLRTKRTWPWRLRRAIVVGMIPGLLVLLLLSAQALFLIQNRG